MRTLTLDLGARSYPIFIGRELLTRSELYVPYLDGRQVLVVSNDVVAPLYLDQVLTALQAFDVSVHIMADGEHNKTMATLEALLDTAVSKRLARDCAIVALGGGVVGDVAGFAAACFQRGVRFIQIPTTLLAQVDSSVGGKTAVNHPGAKNMIGAFHQPVCVIADTATLDTLPDRELAAGLAEVVKYGLIRDPDFFDWIERNANALRGRDPEALAYAVERSCSNKAQVVGADERESGGRALLNLGHTFGHAIEAGLGYGRWLHGEAVAAGMCMASDLSVRIGWFDAQEMDRTCELLSRLGLPTKAPAELTAARMRELMGFDKKVRGGQLRLVLLRAIGRAELTATFDPAALDDTLNNQREES